MMGKIPDDYLPPKELWPEYIVPGEFADTPVELNLADFLLDRHIREGRAATPRSSSWIRRLRIQSCRRW